MDGYIYCLTPSLIGALERNAVGTTLSAASNRDFSEFAPASGLLAYELKPGFI